MERKWLIFIFCLGFALRLFSVLHSQAPIIKDGAIYDSVAVSLSSSKGYTLDGRHPTSEVAPFYPFFLALIYIIFGHNLQIALTIQAVFATITCLLIFELAVELFEDKKIAILSGIISAGYYFFIREGERLWTETIFMFFLVLIVLWYLRMVRLNRVSYAIYFGLSGAALVLTKPLALFFPFLLIGIYSLRIYLRQRKSFSTYMRNASLALLFFVLPIGLWAVRNLIVQKQFVLVATGGGRNFYEAFNPYDGKKYGITVKDEAIKEGESILHEVLRDRFYLKKGFESFFSKSTLELVKLTVIKALTFWSLMDWGAMGNGKVVFNFCTAFILPFSIIAIVLLRKKKVVLFNLLIPIIYFFFLSLAFMGAPRTRMPVEPFLIILAAYTILWLFKKYSNKIIPSIIISIWFIANLILYFNSEYVRIFFKRSVEVIGLW